MKRSVWLDERKGGIEKRPPIGCEGPSWEEVLEARQGQMASSEEVDVCQEGKGRCRLP